MGTSHRGLQQNTVGFARRTDHIAFIMHFFLLSVSGQFFIGVSANHFKFQYQIKKGMPLAGIPF
jgi:hypothetical protein